MAIRSVVPQSAEQVSALEGRLAAVASEPDMEGAWAEYGAIAETAREHDLRLLRVGSPTRQRTCRCIA